MEVNFAFLCDYVENAGPKMTAVGIGVDLIYARNLPAVHPLLHAVISIEFSSTEVGPKELGIRIIDADGSNIIPPLDAQINVEAPQPGFNYRTMRIALVLNRLTFNKYGDYSVNWLLGGTEIRVAKLRVVPAPSQA